MRPFGFRSRQRVGRLVSAGLMGSAAMTAFPASAHHPTGGETPQTLAEGLLSGLAHPVLGPDHLAFMVGVGLVCAMIGRPVVRLLLPLSFVGATMAGTAIHVAGIEIPLAELIIAASVLAIGVLLMRQREVPALVLAGLFALAGLFHGFAYGESIYGAEPTPIGAYLLGLAVVQYGVALGAMSLARAVLWSSALKLTWLRVGGGVAAGVALVYLNQQLMPF